MLKTVCVAFALELIDSMNHFPARDSLFLFPNCRIGDFGLSWFRSSLSSSLAAGGRPPAFVSHKGPLTALQFLTNFYIF